MRSIVDAPFVRYAVPVQDSEIARAYWCSDAAVTDIATTFKRSSAKKVKTAAGHARLSGVACRYCAQEMVVKSRGHAISVLQQFENTSNGRYRIECDPCRRQEQERKWAARRSSSRSLKAAPKVVNPKKPKACPKSAPSATAKNDFYKSWEWRTIRLEVLKEHGRACQCCGAEPGMQTAGGEPVRICVDHIKPLSKHWHLRLEKTNLQVLCDECNMGKGNWDETDFREPPAPDEWVYSDHGIDARILEQLTDQTTGRLQ